MLQPMTHDCGCEELFGAVKLCDMHAAQALAPEYGDCGCIENPTQTCAVHDPTPIMGDCLVINARTLRGRKVDPSKPTTTRGVFDYITANDGWDDSFRVIDDDGMSFVLDDLKAYQGRLVEITVTPIAERKR